MADTSNRNQPAYWDARFSEAGYAYGTEATDFLVSVVDKLPLGDALCLCEGEGRNATFLAARGFKVTAVDFSSVALAKSIALARERGVALQTECRELDGFDPGESRWDAVTVIFGQPAPAIRRALYSRLGKSLRAGGAFVLETKAEDGANAESRYPGSKILCGELVGLECDIARDQTRELKEGRYHDGAHRTAQILAFKR